jgi:hypothetical protein
VGAENSAPGFLEFDACTLQVSRARANTRPRRSWQERGLGPCGALSRTLALTANTEGAAAARTRSRSIVDGARADVDAARQQAVAGGLCGEHVILVEQTAEAVATRDLARRRRLGRRRLRKRRTLLERAVRPMPVVMADVGAHDLLQLASA